jgi:hypothetical protein
MKKLYIIQYDIKEDQKMVERIKTLGSWMKYFPQSMIVQTSLSPKEIYEKLTVDYPNTRILIFRLDNERNSNRYYGWLPNDAWEWLKDK